MRFAKNEAIAKKLFQKKLEDAVSGAHIVYVISEKEHLPLLPDDAFRVLVTADLDVIKERFAQRMRGNLPAPVATMLARKLYKLRIDFNIDFEQFSMGLDIVWIAA